MQDPEYDAMVEKFGQSDSDYIEDLVAERDRYREALERIVAAADDWKFHEDAAHQTFEVKHLAREALNVGTK